MAEYERPPERESTGGTSNTAIVAIVVIILLAVVAFFVFLRPGAGPVDEREGPDIELEVEPPAGNGPLDGGDGAPESAPTPSE